MEHVGAYPFQVTSINPTSYYPLLAFFVVYIIRKENVNDKKYRLILQDPPENTLIYTPSRRHFYSVKLKQGSFLFYS